MYCEDGVSLSSSSSARGEEDERFGAWLLSTRRIDIILVSLEPGFPRFWDSVGVLLLATRFGGRLVALSPVVSVFHTAAWRLPPAQPGFACRGW